MTIEEKYCRYCEYDHLASCKGCSTVGEIFENFKLRDELAKIKNGGKTMNNDYIRYGWVCPKCGAVMAPDEKRCLNCYGAINVTYYDIKTSPSIQPNYPPNIATCTVDINDSKNYTITSEVEQ